MVFSALPSCEDMETWAVGQPLLHCVNAGMSEEMQQDSVECATQELEKQNREGGACDKKYNPTWHCIVGRNFGSYVTHETKHFIYFYLGQAAIHLVKSS
ncbi:dynein light chain 1, cytoplasmic-like [Pteronotus mesoamericanus]|uniref:dynein light chain 1, cytoplasmic-like n=1 Tax=Pteronotus mesoamericanus TaxID=1884717 RepID=UPI0023EB271A|nr:dynein light chain 1, cytoplasmic-like [Pteronotus parnellii mesoamericanus]